MSLLALGFCLTVSSGAYADDRFDGVWNANQTCTASRGDPLNYPAYDTVFKVTIREGQLTGRRTIGRRGEETYLGSITPDAASVDGTVVAFGMPESSHRFAKYQGKATTTTRIELAGQLIRHDKVTKRSIIVRDCTLALARSPIEADVATSSDVPTLQRETSEIATPARSPSARPVQAPAGPKEQVLLSNTPAAERSQTPKPGPICTDKRHALVIGNGAYPDLGSPLGEPIANAQQFSQKLLQMGFEVDVFVDATKEQTQRALLAFYAKLDAHSSALVFFSGLGVQSSGQTYLLPVNAQVWVEHDVRRDGFGVDGILAELEKRGARNKLAIIDAARPNPFERRFRATGSAGLSAVNGGTESLLLYSTAPGILLRNDGRNGNLFLKSLTTTLEIKGIGAEEAFKKIRLEVAKASHNDQTPWMSSSLSREFYFMPQDCTAADQRAAR